MYLFLIPKTTAIKNKIKNAIAMPYPAPSEMVGLYTPTPVNTNITIIKHNDRIEDAINDGLLLHSHLLTNDR